MAWFIPRLVIFALLRRSDFFSLLIIQWINGISRYSRDNVFVYERLENYRSICAAAQFDGVLSNEFLHFSLVNKLVIDRLGDIVSAWNSRRRLLFDSSFNRVRHRAFRFLFDRRAIVYVSRYQFYKFYKFYNTEWKILRFLKFHVSDTVCIILENYKWRIK